ncbi:hypothetical protein ACSV9I_04510 [Rhizobium sp. G187]|uniref:hypothetical protein n=1 Tax=Rhizobium sp. G187 TaxID=3451352 RepID=UPI003EE4BA3E
MEQYKAAWGRIVPALDAALYQLEISIPRARTVNTPTGPNYRFVEKTLEQAILIKCVRLLSALKALRLLLSNGLALDAGASMRVMDEVGTDVLFLAGPIVFGNPPEKRHEIYLTELFQEQFEGVDVLTSNAKRVRVSRSDIRAYVARTYSGKTDVQKHVNVTEVIEQVFSGFIHGAAIHTMDSFDGVSFAVPSNFDHPPLRSTVDQFGHYFQRAIGAFCIASQALGRRDVFDVLYKLDRETFDEFGELLKLNAQNHPQT